MNEYERNEESASKDEEERIDYLFEKWFAGTDLEKNCDESYPVGWRQSIFRWTFASGYRMGTHEDPKNRDISVESKAETVRALVKDIELKDEYIANLERENAWLRKINVINTRDAYEQGVQTARKEIDK